MTTLPRYAIVFNPSVSQAVVVDDDRTCEPSSWAVGNLELCAPLISDGRLVETDPDTINDQSNPDVILVKEQVAELNKEIKKEQRKEDRADKKANEKTEK